MTNLIGSAVAVEAWFRDRAAAPLTDHEPRHARPCAVRLDVDRVYGASYLPDATQQ